MGVKAVSFRFLEKLGFWCQFGLVPSSWPPTSLTDLAAPHRMILRYYRCDRGLPHFSDTFQSIFFSWIFSRFSSHFSYRFKILSGAVSFCRRAALTLCVAYPPVPFIFTTIFGTPSPAPQNKLNWCSVHFLDRSWDLSCHPQSPKHRNPEKSQKSGKKKEHKDKLFGSGDRPVGWGSSARRGGDRKVRALLRKFVILGFRREESGMSREFCRDVPGPLAVFKKFVQKKFVRIFRSLKKVSREKFGLPPDPRPPKIRQEKGT